MNYSTSNPDQQRILVLEQAVSDLENMLLRAAEVVAAQTFDVKSLAKGRRDILVTLVQNMLSVVDGDVRPIRAVPSYYIASPARVRARFPDDLQ